jgi:hypothetical protein
VSTSSEARLRPSSGVVAKPLGEGVVIVNMTSGRCWQLNRLGAEVWELLGQHCAVNEICDALVGVYPVSREVVSADVRALVADLVREGLVETAPATPGTAPDR